MPRRLTTKEFIAKAKLIHGDKYDYSNVIYIGTYDNIHIVCPLHGNYYQMAHNHLLGKGCSHCAGNIQSNTKEFIEKASVVHNNIYDYSLVKYISNISKVKIICQKHGVFLQTAVSHLSGNGCRMCAGNIKSNIDVFIEKANEIHKNRYDYSKSKYNGALTKIIIICPKHGDFIQRPRRHLDGQSCPVCTYRISKKEIEFLNTMNIYMENRQKCICRYNVDGYDPNSNTIYEFLGDYWHGNPNKFNHTNINSRCKKSFGELYNNTISKFNVLKNNGYNVKYIWEEDWERWNKNNRVNDIPIQNFI